MEIYPITERALSTNVEIKDEYNLYMVLDTLRGIYGLAAPWYSSKGNAEQIRLEKNSYVDEIKEGYKFWENSCDKLILEGFLLKIATKKGKKRMPMLYGGTDK